MNIDKICIYASFLGFDFTFFQLPYLFLCVIRSRLKIGSSTKWNSPLPFCLISLSAAGNLTVSQITLLVDAAAATPTTHRILLVLAQLLRPWWHRRQYLILSPFRNFLLLVTYDLRGYLFFHWKWRIFCYLFLCDDIRFFPLFHFYWQTDKECLIISNTRFRIFQGDLLVMQKKSNFREILSINL